MACNPSSHSTLGLSQIIKSRPFQLHTTSIPSSSSRNSQIVLLFKNLYSKYNHLKILSHGTQEIKAHQRRWQQWWPSVPRLCRSTHLCFETGRHSVSKHYLCCQGNLWPHISIPLSKWAIPLLSSCQRWELASQSNLDSTGPTGTAAKIPSGPRDNQTPHGKAGLEELKPMTLRCGNTRALVR